MARKITLDLGNVSMQRIDRLKEALDARTVVEVIRQALKLLEYFVKQAVRGREFLLRDPTTGEVEVVTILELVPETGFQAGSQLEAPV